GALLDGPVTEEAQADPVVLFILVRKGDADPQRDVPANDPVASEESLLGTEEVHRPAFPPRAAVDFAEELGHPGFRTHPERQCKAVIAICRYHRVVTYPQGLHRSRRYGLLTDVQVQEPCNFLLAVHLRRTLFETALQQHAAVHRQHFVVRQPEFLVVVGFSLVRFERYLDVDSVRQDYDLPVRTIRALNAGCRLRRFTFGFRRLRHVHRTVFLRFTRHIHLWIIINNHTIHSSSNRQSIHRTSRYFPSTAAKCTPLWAYGHHLSSGTI